MTKLVIEGRQTDVEAVWNSLKESELEQFSVEQIEEVETDPLSRQPAGMEPLTYFVVVFAGHLTASAAHELIEKKLGPAAISQWKKLRTKSD